MGDRPTTAAALRRNLVEATALLHRRSEPGLVTRRPWVIPLVLGCQGANVDVPVVGPAQTLHRGRPEALRTEDAIALALTTRDPAICG